MFTVHRLPPISSSAAYANHVKSFLDGNRDVWKRNIVYAMVQTYCTARDHKVMCNSKTGTCNRGTILFWRKFWPYCNLIPRYQNSGKQNFSLSKDELPKYTARRNARFGTSWWVCHITLKWVLLDLHVVWNAMQFNGIHLDPFSGGGISSELGP